MSISSTFLNSIATQSARSGVVVSDQHNSGQAKVQGNKLYGIGWLKNYTTANAREQNSITKSKFMAEMRKEFNPKGAVLEQLKKAIGNDNNKPLDLATAKKEIQKLQKTYKYTPSERVGQTRDYMKSHTGSLATLGAAKQRAAQQSGLLGLAELMAESKWKLEVSMSDGQPVDKDKTAELQSKAPGGRIFQERVLETINSFVTDDLLQKAVDDGVKASNKGEHVPQPSLNAAGTTVVKINGREVDDIITDRLKPAMDKAVAMLTPLVNYTPTLPVPMSAADLNRMEMALKLGV